MKKITKTLLVSALIIGITGAVLVGAGIMTGASVSDLKRSEMNVRFFGAMKSWINHTDSHEDKRDDREDIPATDDSFEAEKVEKLSVEAAAGKIEIQVIPDCDTIRISGLHKSDEIKYKEDEKELCVERTLQENKQERTLLIEIPENKELRKLDLDVEAGEIKTFGKLKAEECSFSVSVGNLEAEFIDCRESNLECSVGNLEAAFSGKADDYAIHTKCDAGNLEIGDRSCFGWHHGDVHEERRSSRKINAECSLGNLIVSFKEK